MLTLGGHGDMIISQKIPSSNSFFISVGTLAQECCWFCFVLFLYFVFFAFLPLFKHNMFLLVALKIGLSSPFSLFHLGLH